MQSLHLKGIGRVRIEPVEGLTVDVYVTHTCAGGYNSYYRQRQVDGAKHRDAF